MDCVLYNRGTDTYNEYCEYEFGSNYDIFDKPYSLYDEAGRAFIACMLFIVAVLFSGWFSGLLIYKEMEEEAKQEKKERYEDKYKITDFHKEIKRNNEITKNTSVMEKTPSGTVIMRYNTDREGFEYWCDNKNIKYDILEVVARKFVLMNHCCNIYHDRKLDIKKQMEKIEEKKKMIEEEKDRQANKTEEEQKIEEEKKIEEELMEKDDDPDDSVFVTSSLINKVTKIKKKNEIMENLDIKEKDIVAQKANRYLHIGKISEFEWLKVPKKETAEKKISYSDWFSINRG